MRKTVTVIFREDEERSLTELADLVADVLSAANVNFMDVSEDD